MYSTSVLGPARAFNRAVKLAHAATYVVLLTGATSKVGVVQVKTRVESAWLRRAALETKLRQTSFKS